MAIRGVLATVPGWDAKAKRTGDCDAGWPAAIRLLRDDRGASASQYALVATLICLAIIGSVMSLGTSISALYNKPTSVVTKLAT